MLHLSLLGTPTVRRDGSPVAFDTRKAVALLAVLAVEAQPKSRERLAAMFWPEAPADRARSALRRTLSVALSAVGPVLIVDRAAVALATGGYACDVAEFTRLASASDTETLQEAAGLYRDDFLAGFSLRDAPDFDDWVHEVGDGLRLRLGDVLDRLVRALVGAGELERAIAAARRRLGLDPLHEPAHQVLIQLYGWTGQRSAALRQYRECVQVLDRELGVGPLAATQRLVEDLRAGRLQPQPVRRSGQPHAAEASEQEAVPALPVAGREPELAALQAIAARPARHGQVVVVTGPAGVGKTRLLAVLEEQARSAGRHVVAVRCHERERSLAYGMVVELLNASMRVRPELANAMPAATARELARLVPAFGGEAPVVDPLTGPGAVARLYAAVTDAVVAATAHGTSVPGVLLVDDADAADPSSAEWLAYLLRRLPSTALTVAVADSGDYPAGSPLPGALSEAGTAGYRQVVSVGPLDEKAVAALLAAAGLALAADDVAALHRETGGLPFLVTAYAAALRAATRAGDEAPGVPADVRGAVLARLATVSEITAQVLAAAAIHDGPADVDVLRETSGRTEAETVEAAEQAMRAGLLSESFSGDARYDFTYAAARRVIRSELSAARRRLLHRRAAAALQRRRDGMAAAVLARHLEEAGELDAARHWHWQAAAQARALFAHQQALEHVEAARALGHPLTEAHLVAGELLTTLGRYRDALHEYEAAAASIGAAQHDGDAEATRQLATVEHRLADVYDRLGDYPVAEDHAEAALALLAGAGDASDGHLFARVVADRALIAYRRGASERAQRLAGDALAAAQRTGDAATSAQALDVLGMLAVRAGDLDGGERLLTQSLEQARTLADPSATVAALNNLSRLYAERNELEQALAAAEEALGLGVAYGDRHRAAALHTNLADLLHAADRTHEAMAHLKKAAALFADVDDATQRRPEVWKLVQW